MNKRAFEVRPLILCCATALAAAAAGHVRADQIDLNAELVKRLKAAGQLNALYKAQTGRDLPASLGVQAIFTGDIGGKGLKISVPAVIPTSPLVLQQDDVVNCNSEPMSQQLQIDSTSTKSSNFQNTDTFENTKEYTVTVGYDSPWGVSASASTTQGQSSIKMTSAGGEESGTLSWKYNPTIPIAANKQVTTQFVVTQQKLDNVPYFANFILTGPVQLVFSAGAEGYTWVPRRGGALPTSPFPPLAAGKEGSATNYICRITTDQGTWMGKTQGATCYYGQNKQSFMGNMYPGGQTETYDFLVGRQAAFQLGDPFSKNSFDADGKGMQICVQQSNGRALPGFVAADGSCVSEYGHWSVISRTYQVVLDPHVGGVTVNGNIEQLLPKEADRTFNLRGVFSGVYGVKGSLRIGPANPATDCELVGATSMAIALPGGKGAGGGTAKPHAPTVHVKKKPPGAPLPESATVQLVPPTH